MRTVHEKYIFKKIQYYNLKYIQTNEITTIIQQYSKYTVSINIFWAYNKFSGSQHDRINSKIKIDII
jgi:hypothetical protein